VETDAMCSDVPCAGVPPTAIFKPSDIGLRVRAPVVRGGLATWRQKRVADYIEEHLADTIRLATLAGMVRLSPFHFARAFRQSFGVPPHRFHNSRRIERAKALLADDTLSMTEIGLRLGFSESSAFATSFRKLTGLTPSDYRRALELRS
jgi:AraC family transcriptional regulator